MLPVSSPQADCGMRTRVRLPLLAELEHFETRAAAQVAVFDYIEVFYNRQRIHTSIDYTHPTAYEARQQP